MKNTLTDDWLNFWQTREITPERDRVWRMNMDFFIKSSESFLNYSEDDTILDIGCGAGYLEEILKNRVKEIHAIDVARKYLDVCRHKFRGETNIFIYQLDQDNYTNLSAFKSKKFSKIICISVIQYYKKRKDVLYLIRAVRNITKKGALFLIADIPSEKGSLLDLWSTIWLGLKNFCPFYTFKYLVKMRMTDYHQVKSQIGFLSYPEDYISSLQDELNYEYEIIKDQLTINKSRFHWLIKFD